jgi:hypothetical protein
MPQSLAVSTPQIEYPAGLPASFDEEVERLRAHYNFERPAQVIEYLKDHRYLTPVLLAAVSALQKVFGADSRLRLRTVCDEECCWLHASVLWAGDVEPARDCRDAFDAAWWMDHTRETQGNLVIDVEFVE